MQNTDTSELENRNRLPALSEFYLAPNETLFDQSTVASVLNCSTSKLERDRWIGQGIRFLKIGRSVRYKKCDVLTWLENQQHGVDIEPNQIKK